MSAVFYKGGLLGKEGPYECKVLGRWLIWRVIRYRTSWDNGSFYTYRTRIKCKWNVEEDGE